MEKRIRTVSLGLVTTAVPFVFIKSFPKLFNPKSAAPSFNLDAWLLQASAPETPDKALFHIQCLFSKTLIPAASNYPKKVLAFLCYGRGDKSVLAKVVCLLYRNLQTFEKASENVYRENL